MNVNQFKKFNYNTQFQQNDLIVEEPIDSIMRCVNSSNKNKISNIKKAPKNKEKQWNENVKEILKDLPEARKYLILNGSDVPWNEQNGRYGTYLLIYHVLQLIDEEKRFAFNRYLENRVSKNQIILTTSTKDKKLWDLIGLKSSKVLKRAKFINIKAFTDPKIGFLAKSTSYKDLGEQVIKFQPQDHEYWENAANKSLETKDSPIAISYEPKKWNFDANENQNSPEDRNPYVEKRKSQFNQVRIEKRRRDDHLPLIGLDKSFLPSISLDNLISIYQGNREKNKGKKEKKKRE
jgi:hypothetical protein